MYGFIVHWFLITIEEKASSISGKSKVLIKTCGILDDRHSPSDKYHDTYCSVAVIGIGHKTKTAAVLGTGLHKN